MAKDIKLYVSGMSCNGCVNSVRTILSNNLGIDKDSIDVNIEGGSAIIRTDEPLDPNSDQLAETLYELKKQGFPAQKAD